MLILFSQCLWKPVPRTLDSAHAIAHNKVMVIDGETVITGSFNFTKAAEESNAKMGWSEKIDCRANGEVVF